MTEEEKLRQHYELEKNLAAQLMAASASERKSLYGSLYDQLFREIPWHPQLVKKASPKERMGMIRSQMKFILPHLTEESTYLEVGPGDCLLTFEVAKKVKRAFGLDVSSEVTKASEVPENFALLLSDGTSVPVEPNSIDVVYSHQLMEHLHPDDALQQLQNIYTAMKPGAAYICLTPNRLSGPHDVSRHFDEVATGFHLKEYSAMEAYQLFTEAGFSQVQCFTGGRGTHIPTPTSVVFAYERFLQSLSPSMRRKLLANPACRIGLCKSYVATK